jgi:hypothetical protein
MLVTDTPLASASSFCVNLFMVRHARKWLILGMYLTPSGRTF